MGQERVNIFCSDAGLRLLAQAVKMELLSHVQLFMNQFILLWLGLKERKEVYVCLLLLFNMNLKLKFNFFPLSLTFILQLPF